MKKGPIDRLVLTSSTSGNDVIVGGTKIEYKADAGATKYLIGTEQGTVLSCERKSKKDGNSDKSIKTVRIASFVMWLCINININININLSVDMHVFMGTVM